MKKRRNEPGYMGRLEGKPHKEKYPKISTVDPQERYDRVYGFMKRDSGAYSAERRIDWYENLIKEFPNSRYINETRKFIEQELTPELDEAKEKRLRLTLQVLSDMENGTINNTTQGIWLSYPYTIEVVEIDGDKNKHCIVHLCTGEKFSAIRKWIVWRKANGKIYTQYYGNIELLEKLK